MVRLHVHLAYLARRACHIDCRSRDIHRPEWGIDLFTREVRRQGWKLKGQTILAGRRGDCNPNALDVIVRESLADSTSSSPQWRSR